MSVRSLVEMEVIDDSIDRKSRDRKIEGVEKYLEESQ